jgi:hypothetical protein
VRHRSFVVATLALGVDEIPIHHGDLVVAGKESSPDLDWELVAHALDRSPIDQGAHHLTMVTADGRDFHGDAIVVRSVAGTHVFRGAGPLVGIDPDELT